VPSDLVLRHHFCLGNVITTVDAVNGARQLDAQPEGLKQVAVADRLVLTKTDLATAEVVDCLTQRLRHINPARRSGVAPKTISVQTRCFQPTVTAWSTGSGRIALAILAIRPTIITATPTIFARWRSASTSRSIGRGSASG
jgi:CobW/HypB/UreG, nucleotide-binding domain